MVKTAARFTMTINKASEFREHTEIIMIMIIIIITNRDKDNVYGAVIVAQSHCESSPGSYDECGTAPSGRRPSDQAKQPGL